MTPTDYISELVYEKYLWPALERGEKKVTIEADDVHDILDGAYSRRFVCGVLGSPRFSNTCHVALESAEVAPAGMTYTFRLDLGRSTFA
jgi:hypothetical protein